MCVCGELKFGEGMEGLYFRDIFFVLFVVEDSLGDVVRVFVLEEKGFGFVVLEMEDFIVVMDV